MVQALTPTALQCLTLRYTCWLAGAFAAGSAFGAVVVPLLR
jgi:hypothetical protein